MKLPLFMLVTVFFICLFSGCNKTTCYYHLEKPCGNLNGKVKKVTDTVYTISGGEILYPVQVIEYHFDSLQRLTEEKYCNYRIIEDASGKESEISLMHQQMIKRRYDRDGREVETRLKTCIYQDDTVHTVNTHMILAVLEGNNEMWEISVNEGEEGREGKHRMYRNYMADRIAVDYVNETTQERVRTERVFDQQNNLVESRTINPGADDMWTIYIYGDDNQLSEEKRKLFAGSDEVSSTYYQSDEFDNERNWLKRMEFNGKNEATYITHRRIEYRLKAN